MAKKLDLETIKRDAMEWGWALNDASWTFSRVCPEKSVLLFNNTKAPLRDAIFTYLEHVFAEEIKDEVTAFGEQ